MGCVIWYVCINKACMLHSSVFHRRLDLMEKKVILEIVFSTAILYVTSLQCDWVNHPRLLAAGMVVVVALIAVGIASTFCAEMTKTIISRDQMLQWEGEAGYRLTKSVFQLVNLRPQWVLVMGKCQGKNCCNYSVHYVKLHEILMSTTPV